MTLERDRPETIEELADQFGFDLANLTPAIDEAVEAFQGELTFWSWREGPAYEARHNIRDVHNAARKALDQWRAVPVESQKEVAKFVALDADDPVTEHLEHVVDLLEEFREHYAKAKGRPKRARYGDQNDLRPLEAFIEVIHSFWVEHSSLRFGREVERSASLTDADLEDGGEVLQDAMSSSIMFIDLLLGLLHERIELKYTVRNIETAVSNVKASVSAR